MKIASLVLFFFLPLAYSKKKNENPNTTRYKLTLKVKPIDTYGVELSSYTLKGRLEANAMEDRCFLSFSKEAEKYLKSKLNCQFMSEKAEYNVNTNEFFQMLEEMTVLNTKNKKKLKRQTGIFQNLRKLGYIVHNKSGAFDRSHFPIVDQKDYSISYKHKTAGEKEELSINIKLKKIK